MKKTMILAGMLSIGYASAQQGNTGINTSSPNATLEVKVAGINANNDTNQGILIPKLTKTRVAGIADTKLVTGTLVFVEGTAYTGSNTKVSDITANGFYYYNGTKWTKVEGATLPSGTQANQVLKWNGTAWIVGADADTRYTAGNGLSLSGTTFSANPAAIALGGDVTGNANANTVAKIQGRAVSNTAPTNGQVLKWNQAENIWKPENDANTNTTYTGSTSVVLSGTSFQRAALSGDVTSAQNNNTVTINNGAVTGAKIANGTITADKLAAGVIPTVPAEVDGIVGNEVTNATTARGLVRAGEGTNASPYTLGVADNGITNAMIANNAINSAKIQDGAITGADIANGTITANKLAAGVIPTDTNIYSTNGTLTGNRIVDTGTNNLTIKGNSWFPLIIQSTVDGGTGNNSAGGLAIYADDFNKRIELATTKDGDIRLWGGDGVSKLFIKRASGNTGIGTDEPKAKLDVRGGIRAVQGYPQGDGTNLGYAFGTDGDTGLFSIADPTNNNVGTSLDLYVNNVSRLNINQQGEVKISNLAGTGNRNVMADKDGKLIIGEKTTPIRTATTATTLAITDNGGYVYINSTSAVNVTVPANLPVGFSCVIVQKGTGQVTIVAGAGATAETARGTKTRARHSAVGIIKDTATTFTITGDAVN